MLPPGAALDGIHHTRYERCTEKELECIKRAAEKRGLTREHVREVAVGLRRSDAVAAALKHEAEKMTDGRGRQPGSLTALAKARQIRKQRPLGCETVPLWCPSVPQRGTVVVCCK